MLASIVLPRVALALIGTVVAVPVLAQEPVGCDKFKWPIDHQRALLARAALVAAGAEVALPLAGAVRLPLSPFAEVKLPMSPSRPPKAEGSFAGFVRYAALPHAGSYQVTVSEPAWIDVVQDGRRAKATAFTGATGCDGIRKSVKFDLAASVFVIEISGAATRDIAIAITPD